METIHLRVVYDGAGPVHWDAAAGAFGLQDKGVVLHPGAAGAAGARVFDFTLQVKSPESDPPVLSGDFAHGPPSARFLYLGWSHRRDTHGGFAQRLKLPLATITSDQVRQALAKGRPLVATLVDHHPRATTTGANIGGTRAVDWALA
jgi:hypothetical protein